MNGTLNLKTMHNDLHRIFFIIIYGSTCLHSSTHNYKHAILLSVNVFASSYQEMCEQIIVHSKIMDDIRTAFSREKYKALVPISIDLDL
jgi:hypothetical protein